MTSVTYAVFIFKKYYEKNYEPATYPQHWDTMLFLRQFWIIIKNIVSCSILIVPKYISNIVLKMLKRICKNSQTNTFL
jgi:hypothetical protein